MAQTRAFAKVDTQTWWPTTVASRRADGRIVVTDNGGVWLYRAVRPAIVSEAKSIQEMVNSAGPIASVFAEIASRTPSKVGGRRMSKSSYRRVQILAVNIPSRWVPERDKAGAEYLSQQYPNSLTYERVVLLGVQLRPSLLSGDASSWWQKSKDTIDSFADSFASGVGAALDDFDRDLNDMAAMMTRCGLVTATARQMRYADAWFTLGGPADVPVLHHAEHTHIFRSHDGMRVAERAGAEDCTGWPVNLPGETSFTIASVVDLDFQGATAESTRSLWAHELFGAGALAISISGLVEPAKVTAHELTGQLRRNLGDITALEEAGKLSRADREQKVGLISGTEEMYRTGSASPTLTDASILVAFDGIVDDAESLSRNMVAQVRPMAFRQGPGLFEMMLGSQVRANPNLHDIPADVIACAGLHSLAQVGDRDGAVLGFTEHDRQVVRISPVAASASDSSPMMLIAGSTGSGKTLVGLWLADQFAREGHPVVIVNPKTGSDLSPAVLRSGGDVQSLDDLTKTDGVFDPIRFAARRDVGAEIAASMLMGINPWGRDALMYETPLAVALSYGVRNGAQTTGQALTMARDENGAPADMVNAVLSLRDSNAQFAACVGMNPDSPGLRVSAGITLIQVGDSSLDLPDPGEKAPTQNQRIAVALVRMMVFGSAMAVMGRKGVVMLDEAWVFLGAGKAELEKLGRLGRSQDVLPIMLTQRVTDAVDAGLQGYISRGIILPLKDPKEAAAALELFGLEATGERMARITAGDKKASNVDEGGVDFNWGSMRALVHPETREVLRGSIGIVYDLSERAVNVEVVIPPDFLRDASTNPLDMAKRDRAAAAA